MVRNTEYSLSFRRRRRDDAGVEWSGYEKFGMDGYLDGRPRRSSSVCLLVPTTAKHAIELLSHPYTRATDSRRTRTAVLHHSSISSLSLRKKVKLLLLSMIKVQMILLTISWFNLASKVCYLIQFTFYYNLSFLFLHIQVKS